MNPLDWVTSAAGTVLGAAGEAIFDQMVNWVVEGLADLTRQFAESVAGLASVDVGSSSMTQLSGVFKWVALATVLGTMMWSVAVAVVSPRASLADTLREIPFTLLLLAAWFGIVTVWLEIVAAVTAAFTTDALVSTMSNGLVLDPGIGSFLRGLVAVFMMLGLIVLFVELLVLNHMLAIGVVIGQVAIGLRPSESLRGVSGQMIRNLITMSLAPPLAMASLSLAVGRVDESGLSFTEAFAGLAGIAVSVLMPMTVAKFLPLGGQSGSPGRSLIGAGAQIAATGALMAAGGAGAVAAMGKGASQAQALTQSPVTGSAASSLMSAGSSAGSPGGSSGGAPGGSSGGAPGGSSGGAPGGSPGGAPGGSPGGAPGGSSGGAPGGSSGGAPGGSPGGSSRGTGPVDSGSRAATGAAAGAGDAPMLLDGDGPAEAGTAGKPGTNKTAIAATAIANLMHEGAKE